MGRRVATTIVPDSKKLRSLILLNDDDLESLNDYLGLYKGGLTERLRGSNYTTLLEVVGICKRYNLSAEEAYAVFLKDNIERYQEGGKRTNAKIIESD